MARRSCTASRFTRTRRSSTTPSRRGRGRPRSGLDVQGDDAQGGELTFGFNEAPVGWRASDRARPAERGGLVVRGGSRSGEEPRSRGRSWRAITARSGLSPRGDRRRDARLRLRQHQFDVGVDRRPSQGGRRAAAGEWRCPSHRRTRPRHRSPIRTAAPGSGLLRQRAGNHAAERGSGRPSASTRRAPCPRWLPAAG